MVQGSDRFARHEWSDVQKFRDGLIPDEDGQAPLTTAMRKVAPPSWWSSTLRRKVWPTTSYMDSVRATPFFGLIAVRDRYDLEQSLRAGQIWQRAHLLATARNVAGQPLNQIVELVDHQRSLNQQPQAIAELAELIGDTDWQPTFMSALAIRYEKPAQAPDVESRPAFSRPRDLRAVYLPSYLWLRTMAKGGEPVGPKTGLSGEYVGCRRIYSMAFGSRPHNCFRIGVDLPSPSSYHERATHRR
jgi:hypothetical protein